MKKNKSSFFSLVLPLVVFIGITLAPAREQKILVLVSGETHATLFPCDCPDEPVGGMAKRMHMINTLSPDNVLLLLDAGGFSGGGIYDFYTGGKDRDSLRTLLMIKIMAAMNYDAVALGDEELQYNTQWLLDQAKQVNLPVISANCRSKSGEYISKPYILVKKGSITFAITAVTSEEKLFPLDASVLVHDPYESIRQIWDEMSKKSDYQVILSHLGEENTLLLKEKFPDCEILVNGHRKMSGQPILTYDKQQIMQFGFQGKQLSYLEVISDKHDLKTGGSGWISLEESTQEDAHINALLNPHKDMVALHEAPLIDLYIMAHCPYAAVGLKEVFTFTNNFQYLDFNIWFIGDIIGDDSLHSLHGSAEIEEEMIWLAIQDLYPEMWEHFLYLRISQEYPLMETITDLQLDTTKINKWITKRGFQELKYHYQRSQRLAINSSPTLFINNYLVDQKLTYLRLARDFCTDHLHKARPPICDSLPPCFDDNDCQIKGKIGNCISSGEEKDNQCHYTDAVSFDFVVITPDQPTIAHEIHSIQTTERLFPGAQIRVVAMSSPEGRKYIAENKPQSLPFYLFDKKVERAKNFNQIADGLQDLGQWYTFKKGIMKKSYLLRRNKKLRSLVIFIDPLFKNLDGVLTAINKHFPKMSSISIQPITSPGTGSGEISENGEEKDREALRWLVLKKLYGVETFLAYLEAYSKNQDKFPRETVYKHLKIDKRKFVGQLKRNFSLVNKQRKILHELGITESVELFINNREILAIRNHAHLSTILSLVSNKILSLK